MEPDIHVFWDNGCCRFAIGSKIFGMYHAYEIRKADESGSAHIFNERQRELFSLLNSYGLTITRPYPTTYSMRNSWEQTVNPQFHQFREQLFAALEEQDALVVDRIFRQAQENGQRLRLFYGNEATGEDGVSLKLISGIPCFKPYGGWDLESKRSTFHVPLEQVIKVTQDKKTIYTHPNYHLPVTMGVWGGGSYAVYKNGTAICAYDDEERARRYMQFFEGKRDRI